MLKGLDGVIGVTYVHFLMPATEGWYFENPEPLYGKKYIRELYQLAAPGYDGRCSVPVLWDKEAKKIVSNESSEIMRMLNSEFNSMCRTSEQAALDFYPEPLRAEIDQFNDWILPSINGGVYSCGFAKTQEAYDEAVVKLFQALDRLEVVLSGRRYLTGDQLTEADLRLFTTLVRFDCVYMGHFKCNKKRIADYPNIWGYTRDIYQKPEVKATINFHEIRHHYMESHTHINPTAIVSVMPDVDFNAPHEREALRGQKLPLDC